jgi:hypothetical protein
VSGITPAPTGGGGPSRPEKSDAGTVGSVAPSAKWWFTVEKMPYSTLDSYRKRIGRLCRSKQKHFWQRWDWRAFFTGAAVLFLGGAVGGAIGLVPFWTADPPPSHHVKVEYASILAVTFAFSLVFFLARIGRRAAEAESVEAVFDDFAEMVDAYKEEIERHEKMEALKLETEAKALYQGREVSQ